MLRIFWKFARHLFDVPFPSLRREQRSRNRPDHCGLHARFERLEQRRLLAINPIGFESSTSTIVIQGTPNNDTATVEVATDGAIHVRLQNPDGNFQSVFPSSTAKAVKFYGGHGDNTFQNFSHLPSEAYGDSGKDTFIGGSNNDTFAGGTATIRYSAASGMIISTVKKEMISSSAKMGTTGSPAGRVTTRSKADVVKIISWVEWATMCWMVATTSTNSMARKATISFWAVRAMTCSPVH